MGADNLLGRHSCVIAFIAAVLLHLILLTRAGIIGDSSRLITAASKELTVSLVREESVVKPEINHQAAVDQVSTELVNRPTSVSSVEVVEENTSTNTAIATDIIVTQQAESSDQDPAKLQLSINSKAFRRFLKSETDNYIQQNPESITKFGRGFEAEPLPEESNEFTLDNRANIPRGSGMFILKKEGRETCGAKIDSILSADSQGASGSSYVFKDCTPKKKFDLKLNQPNNGWSSR